MSAIPLQIYYKDPNATLDYTVDWTEWLRGDPISTVAWPSFPAGLTQVSTSNTQQTATTWVSGGTEGTSYDIVCRVTTVGGRIDDRTFRILAVSR